MSRPIRRSPIFATRPSTESVNRKEYAPTIYPPMAQAVFFLVSRMSESVTMMKAAMLAFEALAIFALIELLKAARGFPTVLVSLYALHPLAIWEIAGSGHVEYCYRLHASACAACG